MNKTPSAADRCRTALKAAGWTARQVTVRDVGGSLCDSLVVTIRDRTIDIDAVRKVAETVEEIRYCEITGDVLGGGNTFVRVQYDHRLSPAVCHGEEADSTQTTFAAVRDGDMIVGGDLDGAIVLGQNVMRGEGGRGGRNFVELYLGDGRIVRRHRSTRIDVARKAAP